VKNTVPCEAIDVEVAVEVVDGDTWSDIVLLVGVDASDVASA